MTETESAEYPSKQPRKLIEIKEGYKLMQLFGASSRPKDPREAIGKSWNWTGFLMTPDEARDADRLVKD